MVEDYELAKKIVAKKCGTEGYFYPFMVCALYGLLRKYKDKELITDLFTDSTIIFEEGKMKDILTRNNLPIDTFDLIADDTQGITTFGVSNSGHILSTDKEGNVSFQEETPFVVCSLDHSSSAHLLNTFCHEMGHIIKGEENGYSFYGEDNRDYYIVRTGLAHFVYCYQNHFKDLDFSSCYTTLDEAVNCIQTTEVMQEILGLKEFVDDPRIKKFIEELDIEGMSMDWGYEPIVNLVRQLWDIPSFKSLVEDHIVSGDIDAIVRAIDEEMGANWFDHLNYTLDDIEEKWNQGEELVTPLLQYYQNEVEQYKKKHIQKRKSDDFPFQNS